MLALIGWVLAGEDAAGAITPPSAPQPSAPSVTASLADLPYPLSVSGTGSDLRVSDDGRRTVPLGPLLQLVGDTTALADYRRKRAPNAVGAGAAWAVAGALIVSGSVLAVQDRDHTTNANLLRLTGAAAGGAGVALWFGGTDRRPAAWIDEAELWTAAATSTRLKSWRRCLGTNIWKPTHDGNTTAARPSGRRLPRQGRR